MKASFSQFLKMFYLIFTIFYKDIITTYTYRIIEIDNSILIYFDVSNIPFIIYRHVQPTSHLSGTQAYIGNDKTRLQLKRCQVATYSQSNISLHREFFFQQIYLLYSQSIYLQITITKSRILINSLLKYKNWDG